MLGVALQSMPCLVDARHGFCQDRAIACVLAEQSIRCFVAQLSLQWGPATPASDPDKLMAALVHAHPLTLTHLQLCRASGLLAQCSLCYSRKRIWNGIQEGSTPPRGSAGQGSNPSESL